jgi:hypothetical protein
MREQTHGKEFKWKFKENIQRMKVKKKENSQGPTEHSGIEAQPQIKHS